MGWGRIVFGAAAAVSASAYGAVLDPIATTGHDTDIVFENDGSPAQAEEIGSRWFFEDGLLTGTPPAIGLPSAANNRTISTVLTSGNTVNYAFNDYGANNVIEFEAA